MASFREPYSFYKVKISKGRKVYYYRTYTADGKRTSGRSTGKTSISEAVIYCHDLQARGELIPAPKIPKPPAEVRRSRRPPTLAEWATERKWWQWTDSGPECLYCKGELARSAEGAPAVQRSHADTSARILRDNIIPAHGAMRIDQIRPGDCEALMESWLAEGASPKTINNRASVYRVMMGEAERLEVIVRSPWARVKTYRNSNAKRGIVTMAEYKKLMDPRGIATTWKGRHLHYVVSLVASVTGMRQSEILALRIEDVKPDHIIVSKKYNRDYGDGPQKTKRGTDELPIPRFVYDQIISLGAKSGYIFSRSGGDKPIEGARINEAVKEALAEIGIDEAERVKRNISFHSWRAFANTYFLGRGISKELVQDITRHESDAMTEHYRAFSREHFAEISAAQNALVAGLAKLGK